MCLLLMSVEVQRLTVIIRSDAVHSRASSALPPMLEPIMNTPSFHPGGGMHHGGSGTWEHHQLHPRSEMKARAKGDDDGDKSSPTRHSYAGFDGLDPGQVRSPDLSRTQAWSADRQQRFGGREILRASNGKFGLLNMPSSDCSKPATSGKTVPKTFVPLAATLRQDQFSASSYFGHTSHVRLPPGKGAGSSGERLPHQYVGGGAHLYSRHSETLGNGKRHTYAERSSSELLMRATGMGGSIMFNAA